MRVNFIPSDLFTSKCLISAAFCKHTNGALELCLCLEVNIEMTVIRYIFINERKPTSIWNRPYWPFIHGIFVEIMYSIRQIRFSLSRQKSLAIQASLTLIQLNKMFVFHSNCDIMRLPYSVELTIRFALIFIFIHSHSIAYIHANMFYFEIYNYTNYTKFLGEPMAIYVACDSLESLLYIITLRLIYKSKSFISVGSKVNCPICTLTILNMSAKCRLF